MRILITGGAGFIGHNIAIRFKEWGFNPVSFDSLERSTRYAVQRLSRHGIPLIRGDILDSKAARKALEGADAAVHAAAYIDVEESTRKPLLYLKNNVLGTASVAKACLENKVKLLVYLSSAAVYGEPLTLPVDEEHPLNPISPYGLSKLLGEETVKFFSREGLSYVILRIFNVYGPGQTGAYAGVVAKFIERASRKLPPVIYGDGRQTRDFIHVDDVSEAVKLAVERRVVNETFNIASGKPTEIKDLANLVVRIANLDCNPVYTKPRKADVKHSYADISKARTLLGFNPKINLEEGLTSLLHPSRQAPDPSKHTA